MSKSQDKTKVTRIKAGETATVKKAAVKRVTSPAKKKASVASKSTPRQKRSFGILGRIGGYFKGAWVELHQVHWPTRAATWSLTSAVLLFSLFFVVFITLLDAGFKYVFEQILR